MKVFYAALFLILLHGIAHTQCAGFTLTVSDLQPPSCPNSSDGAITLSVDGAQGVVNYAWSEAGLSSPTIDGLAPGTYSVTATDEGGCQAVEMVVLEAVLVADAGLDITAYCGQDTVRLGSYQEYEVEIVENMFPIRIWNAAGQDVLPFLRTRLNHYRFIHQIDLLRVKGRDVTPYFCTKTCKQRRFLFILNT